MARPARIQFPGALYHITSRGNRQEDIYDDDIDRASFLEVLGNTCQQYHWICHAYCLMSNHYHLLIETPEGNLSRGMRQLNGVYTQTCNRRHNRVGHLFQGRYKAILVEKESYLLELARYIVLNPVRARIVKKAGTWAWSSYRATAGEVDKPEWLSIDWLLSIFSKRKKRAMEQYGAFIAEGKGQPSVWESLEKQIFLGSSKFVEQMQSRIDRQKDLSEVPLAQRRPEPRALRQYERQYKDRNTAITAAYQSGGYTLKQIGEYFGLHYSTVSGIVNNHKSK